MIAALGTGAKARYIPWLPESATSADEAAVRGDKGASDGDESASDQDKPAGQPLGNGEPQVGAPIGPAPADPVSAQDQCDSPEQFQSRDCRDLAAQERMAWAALGQLILTAVGVLLIWRTLVHTRIAAKAARDAVDEAKQGSLAALQAADAGIQANEISRLDQRPWVSIEPCITLGLGSALRMVGVGVQLILRNHGKAPAVRIAADCRLVAVGPEVDLRAVAERFCEQVRAEGRGGENLVGDVIFPGEKVPRDRGPVMAIADLGLVVIGGDNRPKGGLLSLVSCVAYEWTGDKKIHITCAVHNLVRVEGEERHRVFFAVDQEIPRDHLDLERSTEGFAD